MSGNKSRSDFRYRLSRLPGQLALALVNATSVLLIAACVLVIVALGRIEHSAERISAAMTDAVLARFQIEPARLTEGAQAIVSQLHELQEALKDTKEGGGLRAEQLKQQMAEMTEALTGLRGDIKMLTAAKAELSDQAIRGIGDSVTNGLLRLRNCQPVQAQLNRNPT